MHLLCFSEKRSGSAAVRSVGNRQASAPKEHNLTGDATELATWVTLMAQFKKNGCQPLLV